MSSDSSSPEIYAVMGNPIAHSQSPRIHTAFAHQTGQHMVYTAILVAVDGFARALDEFQAGGGKGLSITLPFKSQAWASMDELTPRAERAGAVNAVLFGTDGRRLGDNTDGAGLLRDILHNHASRIDGERILLLGAGGAVRGVLGPLLERGPAQVVIVNRTREKAVALAAEFRSLGPVESCAYPDLRGRDFDLIINGTSASLTGQVPPLPERVLAPGGWCYDMMYGAAPTVFVEWGRAHGAARSVDGLGMLVEQAAESFFLWRGVRPDTAPVIHSLREQLTP
jgi:shikimate dehydrogenase